MSRPRISRKSVADGVVQITLQRPDRLNALTWEMIDELLAMLGEIAADATVRAVILTGEGRGFCSGLDINGPDAVGSVDPVVEVYDRQERVASLATALRGLPQPVIAAVNGPSSGGGFALALASDVRLCAPDARFNVAFVRVGLSGGDVGISHLLPRIVGLGMASEMMLTGRQVGAEEALRVGLANRIVPAEGLLDAAVALALEIATNAPFAVRMTKQVLGLNVDAPSLEAAIELENRTQVLTTRTTDMPEALSAFQERRPARFTGR